MRLTRCAVVAAPLVLLAACNEEVVVPQGDDGREATGEILPSTISDDMIETDRLQSQPPLLRDAPAPEEGEGEVSEEGAEGEASVQLDGATAQAGESEALTLPPIEAVPPPEPAAAQEG